LLVEKYLSETTQLISLIIVSFSDLRLML